MAIKPFGKRMLCRLIPRPDQTATGIVRVETADDAPKMMAVTVIGAEVTRVQVGDTILVGRFTGVDVLGDQLISEEEVLCALDGEHAERWRVEVLPLGEFDAAPIATLYDLPTALRHVGDDGAHLITPCNENEAGRKAIIAHEFVTVRASSPGGRTMVINKAPTAGMFKVAGQFTARGVKDEAGHYGSAVERIAPKAFTPFGIS